MLICAYADALGRQTPKSRFNRRRPKFIEEGAFLSPEAQNLFTISYYAGKGELVPVGWQVVTEDHSFPLISSRMPAASVESESGSGEDHEMTTGRASETSDEDDTPNSNPVSTTRMTEESSDEDELARPINVRFPRAALIHARLTLAERTTSTENP